MTFPPPPGFPALTIPTSTPPSLKGLPPRVDRDNQPNLPLDVLHCSTPKALPLQSDDLAFNEGSDFLMDCNALNLDRNFSNLDKNIDMSNVYTSKMDGVHQMIANLADIENEVDKEMLNKSNGNADSKNTETFDTNNKNTLSYEHMEQQLQKYQPEVNTYSSHKIVSGNRLPQQARRGWHHEESTGRMVHQELGWREPNHLERNFYTPNNRFYRRKKAREQRMATEAMDVDPTQPAQDRLLAKRGASQLEATVSASPEEKKTKTAEEPPSSSKDKKKELEKITAEIVSEDEAKKAEAAKQKRLADIQYWRDPEVQKMTGRIITSEKNIRMSQLDIPRISQIHAMAMEEKIDDDDEAKIDRVTPLRIGLGGRGLKLHLAHEDGWAWWEELVVGIPPLDDKDGGYSYKFLKPGQEPYKFYSCTVSDPRVADKAKGMEVFLRGVRRMNRPLKDIPFTPMAVGMTSVDMIPSTIILMCVAVEDVLAFELALDQLEWQLRMGIEKHRVQASKPPRRWFGGAPGEPRGPPSGAGLGGGAEADEYAEEEALDEAIAKQLVEEEMEMDTDTSKNDGMDKNAKDGAQERRSEDI